MYVHVHVKMYVCVYLYVCACACACACACVCVCYTSALHTNIFLFEQPNGFTVWDTTCPGCSEPAAAAQVGGTTGLNQLPSLDFVDACGTDPNCFTVIDPNHADSGFTVFDTSAPTSVAQVGGTTGLNQTYGWGCESGDAYGSGHTPQLFFLEVCKASKV